MSKPNVVIEAWQLVLTDGGARVLQGLISGHPRLPGRRRAVRTSLILRLDLSRMTAETINSLYHLGRPMTRCDRDVEGRVCLFEVADIIAERTPGTDGWRLRRGPHRIDSLDEPDPDRVLDRMLEHAPRLEDLVARITPENRRRGD